MNREARWGRTPGMAQVPRSHKSRRTGLKYRPSHEVMKILLWLRKQTPPIWGWGEKRQGLGRAVVFPLLFIFFENGGKKPLGHKITSVQHHLHAYLAVKDGLSEGGGQAIPVVSPACGLHAPPYNKGLLFPRSPPSSSPNCLNKTDAQNNVRQRIWF